MKFDKGDIVEVLGVDGVTRFRGTVTVADEHQFTVVGDGWHNTYPQDTDAVFIFSNG